MVTNQLIMCDICGTKINLRTQIGNYNIPFNTRCPNCLTHIYGTILINQEDTKVSIKLVNAINVEYSHGTYYCAELSAEFPTKKIRIRNDKEFDKTPFLRNFMFYGNAALAVKYTQDAMRFTYFIAQKWEEIKSYYKLFWNDKADLLYENLTNEIEECKWIPLSKIENKLDSAIALHQLFLTNSGISFIIPFGELNEYSKISSMILDVKNITGVIKFLNVECIELDKIESKLISLVNVFSEFYVQLVPVVSLKNAKRLDYINREEFGIMTANYEQLENFYAKSYEWILDNIYLLIALNNIAVRKDYKTCINSGSYSDIFNLSSKFQRTQFIEDSEPFSKPTNSLRNKVRNSIQHFDSEIDYVTQNIIFIDTYKGKKKIEEMYLMDFAVLCIENFEMMLYLFEIIYNFRKALFLSYGIKPHIKKGVE